MKINQNASLLANLCRDVSFTGEVSQDALLFLSYHQCAKTAQHSQQVASEARHIAIEAGIDSKKAEIAGWLHDISVVFPEEERGIIARMLGLEVLEEEDRCPMIVHQKLSRLMAQEIFGVTDVMILDAIGCHTTLRARSTVLDKALFVADKIVWDQEGIPPYDAELRATLEQSLDAAAHFFLNYLWQRRESLAVLHPWLSEAYEDFSKRKA